MSFHNKHSDYEPLAGDIVKENDHLQAQVALQKVQTFGAVAIKYVVCGLFIALVALLATSPRGDLVSAFDAPLPLPAELGLE
mgnify:CR=1 FL=1